IRISSTLDIISDTYPTLQKKTAMPTAAHDDIAASQGIVSAYSHRTTCIVMTSNISQIRPIRRRSERHRPIITRIITTSKSGYRILSSLLQASYQNKIRITVNLHTIGSIQSRTIKRGRPLKGQTSRIDRRLAKNNKLASERNLVIQIPIHGSNCTD